MIFTLYCHTEAYTEVSHKLKKEIFRLRLNMTIPCVIASIRTTLAYSSLRARLYALRGNLSTSPLEISVVNAIFWVEFG